MSIFYTLLFIYIIILMTLDLFPILIYFLWGLIVLKILLYIRKIIFPGRRILYRIGS
jgi:hypothetical protein